LIPSRSSVALSPKYEGAANQDRDPAAEDPRRERLAQHDPAKRDRVLRIASSTYIALVGAGVGLVLHRL
jgi:hypothetical protein